MTEQNCQCTIDAMDGCMDGPEAFRAVMRKARKPHKCYECGRAIEPGERYEVASGIWDGRPDRFKTCPDCLSVRQVFFETWMYGGTWEYMSELANELSGDISTCRIIDLTPAARVKVCDLFQEYYRRYHD